MKRSLPVVFVIVALAAGAIYWQTVLRHRPSREPRPTHERTLNLRGDLSSGYAPRVRVNLTPSDAARVRLAVDGPYVVRPVDDERILGRGDRLDEAEVIARPGGFRIGNAEYRASRIEIVPQTSPAVWVNDHKYRGSVRLIRRPQNTLIAVNTVPLEDYIASVIDSEMPAAFPDDARRAQAVVSRTYVLYQMQVISPESPFDVYASTRSQKYLGVEYRDTDGRRLAGESVGSRQIALDTAGTVCTWQGRIFCTYYSAVCGGQTTLGTNVFTDAAEPVRSVPCEWCEASPHYRWTVRMPRRKVGDLLKQHFADTGKSFDRLVSIRPSNRSTPAIGYFEVSDGKRKQTVASTAMVRSFPPATLPSPRFDIRVDGDDYVFEGRGHGHGVGLCQWGARGLAESGKGCLEIIDYYYPGAKIVVIDGPGP